MKVEESPVQKGRPSIPVSMHPNLTSAGQMKRASIAFGIALGEINSLGYSVGPISYLNCFVNDQNQYRLGNFDFQAYNSKRSKGEMSTFLDKNYTVFAQMPAKENMEWRVGPEVPKCRFFSP